MLYTLSLFATEPVRFIEAYEWRKLTDLEKCALGVFWKSVGDAFEISYDDLPSGRSGRFRDGLHWLEEIESWSRAYEKRAMVPAQSNRETAAQTTAVLVYMLPQKLKFLGEYSVSFMMDERLRKAMGYVLSLQPKKEKEKSPTRLAYYSNNHSEQVRKGTITSNRHLLHGAGTSKILPALSRLASSLRPPLNDLVRESRSADRPPLRDHLAGSPVLREAHPMESLAQPRRYRDAPDGSTAARRPG